MTQFDFRTTHSKIFASLVATLLLSVGWLAPGSAATMTGEDIHPFSIGGRATYYRPKDADKGNLYGGAQLRYRFAPVFGAEVSADYRRDTFGSTTTRTYPVQGSLLAYFVPNAPVSLFALVGAGVYFTHVEGPGIDTTQNRVGPHLGGGLQFFLDRYWSIDATYRYVWLEDVKSNNDALVTQKFHDSGHMVTAGLNYHF